MSSRIGRRTARDGTVVPRRRPWIVPPRLLTVGEEGERHATWLELDEVQSKVRGLEVHPELGLKRRMWFDGDPVSASPPRHLRPRRPRSAIPSRRWLATGGVAVAAVAAAAVTIVAVRDGGAHPSATVPTLAGVSTTKPTTQAPTTAAPGPAPSTTSAGAPPSAAPQPLQPTPGNLLANGDFERDLGGWSLLGNSRVDRVAVAHSGTWAVRISANRPEPGQPRSQRPGILADHAFQPEQDNSYQAAAWFRASTPGTEAMLALREYGADGETSADVIGVTLPDAGWHEVTVVHRVQHPGARLTLEATAVDLRPDADLLVDQVSITAS